LPVANGDSRTWRADRLISLIRPENAPSQRVAERNGMKIWKEIDWRGFRHRVYSVSKLPAPSMKPWHVRAGD